MYAYRNSHDNDIAVLNLIRLLLHFPCHSSQWLLLFALRSFCQSSSCSFLYFYSYSLCSFHIFAVSASLFLCLCGHASALYVTLLIYLQCNVYLSSLLSTRNILKKDHRRFPFSGICAVFVLLCWLYLKYLAYTAPKQQYH